jgi:hypothetical protein
MFPAVDVESLRRLEGKKVLYRVRVLIMTCPIPRLLGAPDDNDPSTAELIVGYWHYDRRVQGPAPMLINITWDDHGEARFLSPPRKLAN